MSFHVINILYIIVLINITLVALSIVNMLIAHVSFL